MTRAPRALLLITGLTFLVVACGDSDSTTSADSPTTTSHSDDHEHSDDEHSDDEHDDHGHGHADEREVDAADAPTVAIEVLADPTSGWNLHATLTNFRLAPENVSTDHVDGEGHMHVYVDGVKLGRIYGEWFHLGQLEPGDRHIRVELSSNDHAQLTVDGEPIEVEAMVTVPETTGGHSHGEAMQVEAVEPLPSVTVEVIPDPTGGWTLRAVPTNFRLAPENVSTDHVDGEGHMHLYVDGRKVTRLYGEWLQLPALEPGHHEIRVELSSNDHSVITIDGIPVDVTAALMVEGEATDGSGEESHDHDHSAGGGSTGEPTPFDADVADAVQTVEVSLAGGRPDGGVVKVNVEVGSVIALHVTSDTDDIVHVHGYDILRTVGPNADAHFAFTAEIPGVFEVELEDSHQLILELEIS